MTAGTGSEKNDRAVPARAAPTSKGTKPRRPKFDKAASTTVLLAALLGLGAGATWQLASAAPKTRGAEDYEPALASPAGAPQRVIVVDTTGLVVATFDGVAIRTTDRPAATVALSRGRSKAPVARSRAS